MIPIVSIEAESLTDWEGKKDERQAVLSYYDPISGETFRRDITIRPQGTSSLGYDKKNFTIEMVTEGVQMRESWGVQSGYCLKADYIDPTRSCNTVSAKLGAQMQEKYGLFPAAPNRGLIDGFPVWVFLNGENAGIYAWNIPKDAWMFGMNESNGDHLVLCSEGWEGSCVFYADTFVPDEEWSFEVGEETPENIEKFNRVLRFINSSSDEEFMADFDEYLDLNACLNYFCYALISYGSDNMGKNMLMVTYDGKVWSPSLYDLDSLWGIDYDGLGMMEELIPVEYVMDEWINHLYARLLRLFPDEFAKRYNELRQSVLSEENILQAFYDYIGSIPEICYEMDSRLWNPDGTYIRTLELMEETMKKYLPVLDGMVAKLN